MSHGPRELNHSNNILTNDHFSTIIESSIPLKVQLFLSLHQEVGNDRVWNLRFYRDFHDWEQEAVFSFLDFIQSRIPRGVGCDSLCWCINGNGKFDTRSYYHEIQDVPNSIFP